MIEVGDYTYGHEGIELIHSGEDKTLYIGKFCSIAKDVKIFLGGNHRVDWFTTFPFGHHKELIFPKLDKDNGHPTTNGDVIIGNDVWLATGCVIMSGVKVGDGAVIAAYSVVTKDVEPYTIVGGNPAKVIRKRFTDDIINKLLDLQWWNKTNSEINDITDILCSDNVEKLKELE